MAGRLRILALGAFGGLVWGALLAVPFGASLGEGARLGIALFTPAIVLSMRPRAASAADTIFVP